MAGAISKWRMSEDMARGALIGPNAVLQLLPQIERIGGAERVAQMLAEAGIFDVPDGSHMITEGDAARLHQVLRRDEPELAPQLASKAGRATADYILAHRIPEIAQLMLKLMPAPLAARALSKAIAKHAWTFAGSGSFRVVTPWRFEIVDNPIVRGERSDTPLCHWHAAVFERLYQVLVDRTATCREVACCAVTGGNTCRFDITLTGRAGA